MEAVKVEIHSRENMKPMPQAFKNYSHTFSFA